ncbi:hypothetical protein FEE95_17815 [Maribacter algarum]|uniref:Uncharacterized protein n=1 Tax=Maribacter algarum (ex Zhang et al. 2020) TaxID=2578118 RepID=A0A5S3PMV8_9FLAO|nr:hypothetical protein [Maribacter algarum]TMM53756.1 hypothetical protein FEE95_17815 [Maribacter algarum]
MIDTDLFQNSYLLWPVAIAASVLWILFVWKEWSTPIKKRFYFHSLISLITILSLAMLALKPLSKRVVQSNAGVLLTNGYSQKHLDSLKKSIKGITILDYQENAQIGQVLDSLGNLFVLGNGVASYDFWQFENRSVRYLGAEVPSGIIDLKYTQENVLGEPLKIEGRYHNARASHRLVLQDGNSQGLDSLEFNSETIQAFELSTPLKAIGNFVFQLVEKDSLGEAILKEPLPFKVIDKNSLKILLVNSFPTFETKYLKNYLAEMGHEVVVRSQLTRGRYKFEYFNTKRIPIYRFGEKELENFDLLFIDGTSFRNLSTRSWTSIEKTIQHKGMGLFVQSEASLFDRSSKRHGLEFEKDGIPKATLNEFPKVLLEKFTFRFKDVDGIEEIHTSKGNLVTAYKRIQQGRIGASVIQNTYQLQLDGKTGIYRQFWSEIVNKLSKKKTLLTDWEVTNNFPLENHPFQFELRTSIEKPQVFSTDKYQIALRQHVDIPSLWSSTTYPKNKGWNSLLLKDKTHVGLDFFVVDSTTWQSLRTKRRQKANRRFFTAISDSFVERTITASIHPIWFFLVALFGFGYLWVYPKVFQN